MARGQAPGWKLRKGEGLALAVYIAPVSSGDLRALGRAQGEPSCRPEGQAPLLGAAASCWELAGPGEVGAAVRGPALPAAVGTARRRGDAREAGVRGSPPLRVHRGKAVVTARPRRHRRGLLYRNEFPGRHICEGFLLRTPLCS